MVDKGADEFTGIYDRSGNEFVTDISGGEVKYHIGISTPCAVGIGRTSVARSRAPKLCSSPVKFGKLIPEIHRDRTRDCTMKPITTI